VFLVRGSGRFPNAFVISMKKPVKKGSKSREILHHGPMDCMQLHNLKSIVKEIRRKKKVEPLTLNPGSLMSGNPSRSRYVSDELVLNSLSGKKRKK